MNVNETLNLFVNHYGDGANGNAPSITQWQRILERDPAKPFALINFFKFNETANYDGGTDTAAGGDVAFQRSWSTQSIAG